MEAVLLAGAQGWFAGSCLAHGFTRKCGNADRQSCMPPAFSEHADEHRGRRVDHCGLAEEIGRFQPTGVRVILAGAEPQVLGAALPPAP
jgi:hypothetical protein